MAKITLCCYKMENEIHLLTIATQSVYRGCAPINRDYFFAHEVRSYRTERGCNPVLRGIPFPVGDARLCPDKSGLFFCVSPPRRGETSPSAGRTQKNSL